MIWLQYIVVAASRARQRIAYKEIALPNKGAAISDAFFLSGIDGAALLQHALDYGGEGIRANAVNADRISFRSRNRRDDRVTPAKRPLSGRPSRS
jgi:hypothetical protein